MKSVMITPIRLAAKPLSYWIFKKVVKSYQAKHSEVR